MQKNPFGWPLVLNELWVSVLSSCFIMISTYDVFLVLVDTWQCGTLLLLSASTTASRPHVYDAANISFIGSATVVWGWGNGKCHTLHTEAAALNYVIWDKNLHWRRKVSATLNLHFVLHTLAMLAHSRTVLWRSIAQATRIKERTDFAQEIWHVGHWPQL